MLKENENFEKDARARRLVQARKAAGLSSAVKAAERFGWNANNYKAHEAGRNGFGISDARRYAKAFGADVAWLQTGDGPIPQPGDLHAHAANGNVSDGLIEIKKPIDQIPISGRVAANTWLDVEDTAIDYDNVEYVPSLSGYPAAWQFAYRVDGNCLNKVAKHNDVLVCLNIIASGDDVFEDDLVIVQRSRYGGQMIERTAKRVRRTSRGTELWPDSTDPAHQEPIALYEKVEEIDVQIIGKVLWILRRP